MSLQSIAVILCLAFILHVSILINNKLSPDLPDIQHYKKHLKEISFPIAFKFCIEEKNNHKLNKKYRDLGYNDLFDFYYGRSMFNNSIVGWAGHTENGSTIGSVEGLKIKYKYIFYNFLF